MALAACGFPSLREFVSEPGSMFRARKTIAREVMDVVISYKDKKVITTARNFVKASPSVDGLINSGSFKQTFLSDFIFVIANDATVIIREKEKQLQGDIETHHYSERDGR
jgi:hypothetical protein